MYGRSDETGESKYLNVDWAVNYWLKNGLNSDKLIMGLPTYGRSFRLSNSKNHELGSPASEAGLAGKVNICQTHFFIFEKIIKLFIQQFTKEAGFLSYYEICDKLTEGWKREWNQEHQSAFAYNDNEWVGYDDVESFKVKAQYILDQNLGGAMFWSLDLDDFSGSHCGQGKYPLINTIKKFFQENQKQIVTSTQATTTTTTTTIATTITTMAPLIIYNKPKTKTYYENFIENMRFKEQDHSRLYKKPQAPSSNLYL